MNTVLEHFQTLPEPERSQSIQNTSDILLNIKRPTLRAALSSAFNWEDSPQKHDYWFAIWKRYTVNNF